MYVYTIKNPKNVFQPRHKCVDKCQHTQTPAALDSYCKEFLVALRQRHQHNRLTYDKLVAKSVAFIVEERNNSEATIILRK